MILRRYGTTYQSVEMNFDSKALNEVSFRRDRAHSIPVEEFETGYELTGTVSLDAEAEGDVQDHTEQVLLDRLQAKVLELSGSLTEGEVLVVENEQGHDWPKTRQHTSNVIVAGENRLHFNYGVDPPLRIGRYRARAG